MENVQVSPDDYIHDGQAFDDHSSRPMPWVDKSRQATANKCLYLFDFIENQKKQPKSVENVMEEKGTYGRNVHIVFSHLFTIINKMELIPRFAELPIEVDASKSCMFYILLDMCRQILPPWAQNDKMIYKYIANFCIYEVDYWNYLSTLSRSVSFYERYWMPYARELYLEVLPDKMFGTIDVVYRNPAYGLISGLLGKKKYIILDYKTTNPPKSVNEGTGIPTYNYEELHFYAYLGGNARKDWNTEKVLTRDDDMNEVEIDVYTGEHVIEGVESFEDFAMNILYLGGDEGPKYIPPRAGREKTMQNVLGKIKKLREVWRSGGPYPKKDNEYVCRVCINSENCLDEKLNTEVGSDD
jgi:hypothetical protein